MVYGVLRFINFAHCDVLMLGAFAAFLSRRRPSLLWTAASSRSPAALVVILLAAAICAGIGMLIEFLAYRPLRARPRLTVLITAIGVSLFIEFTASTGSLRRSHAAFPQLAAEARPFGFGACIISSNDLVVLVLTARAARGACGSSCRRRKIGMAMRAVSFNQQAAALMGVNVNRVISFTFGLGSALAAVAGILYAMQRTRHRAADGRPARPARLRRRGARRHRQPPRRGAGRAFSGCWKPSSAGFRASRITATASPSRILILILLFRRRPARQGQVEKV